MTLACIHSYLVHPDKRKDTKDQTQIRGTKVSHAGKLFSMLTSIYDLAEDECEHDITFEPSANGEQDNPCRTLIVDYLRSPTLPNGRRIAARLQAVTTGKSGLGLLFLLSGVRESRHRMILSRFPADSAILAEEGSDGLTVQFLEKVFMKSATTYKAALYEDKALDGGFWNGRAVDKQINHGVQAISHYWINHFLASDFRATSAHGTRRLAVALLAATKGASPAAQQELVAAAKLAPALAGKATSIEKFCGRFGLSEEAQQAIRDQLPNDAVFQERFRFDSNEFSSHIAVRSVELSNGAILMAPSANFEAVFEKTVPKDKKDEVRYTTQGRVVSQRLRKRRQ